MQLDFELQYLPALVAYIDLLITQLVRELEGLAASVVIMEIEQEDGKQLVGWGYLRPASSDHQRLSDRIDPAPLALGG
jgi:hypothetical protein